MSLSIERRIQVGFGLAVASLIAMGIATLRSTSATARDAGADYLILGRAVTQASDPPAVLRQVRRSLT